MENNYNSNENVNEPISREPINNEPLENHGFTEELIHNEPVSSELTHSESIYSEATHSEPVYKETIHNENISNEPVHYVNSVSEKQKKKGGKFKRGLSYIMVGLVCTVLGGAASGAAILYVFPKTDMFKNAAILNPSVNTVTPTAPAYDGHPTQLAATGEALTVTDISKKVGPAVVAVTTSQTASDYFGRQSVQQGVGTGMIINDQGYILTNYHVVQGAQQVKVKLSNGKEVSAKVVNFDQNYDVAVVKITDNVQVPAVVELGDSDNLQVGESVVAIGNPLGTEFFGSVTTGIVSALNRKIDGDTNNLSYIQTDAAINSGNSGGPLINSRGQVIGINTAKIKESGVEGLGFAIPINAVKNKIPDLSKPVLMVGIQGVAINDTLSKQYNLPIGIYVQDITQFGPAEKAGLKRGDVIIKFDGKKIATFEDLDTLKNKHKSGDDVQVIVNRDGSEQTLTLKLSEQ